MEVIPAVDIKDGRCVRLLRGVEGTETVFSPDPVEAALRWERLGARWLHVVDLDGAFRGEPRNARLVLEIVRAVSIPVQVGGGMRTLEAVELYLRGGAARVVLGTAAFTDPGVVAEACRRFPGRVAVGLDTRGGKVAVKGWKDEVDLNVEGLLRDLEAMGVSCVVHTDISRDGTLEGVDTAPLRALLERSPLPVIASGGVATMDDLERLYALEELGLWGVIVGRAIYTGALDLGRAVRRYA